VPLLVQGSGGKQVVIPLGQVARVEPGYGPMLIKHFNRQRTITVMANTNGKPLSEVMGPIKPKLAAISLPPGYPIRYGGADEDQADVGGHGVPAFTRQRLAVRGTGS
jgi:multidrug efflux pump subunit AcrB